MNNINKMGDIYKIDKIDDILELLVSFLTNEETFRLNIALPGNETIQDKSKNIKCELIFRGYPTYTTYEDWYIEDDICTLCLRPLYGTMLPYGLCALCSRTKIYHCHDCGEVLNLHTAVIDIECGHKVQMSFVFDEFEEYSYFIGNIQWKYSDKYKYILRCPDRCKGTHCTHCKNKFDDCKCNMAVWCVTSHGHKGQLLGSVERCCGQSSGYDRRAILFPPFNICKLSSSILAYDIIDSVYIAPIIYRSNNLLDVILVAFNEVTHDIEFHCGSCNYRYLYDKYSTGENYLYEHK